MPRNAQGVYSLPPGNPVVEGTIIEAQWANTTMPDLGDALTGSLPRDGSAPMVAPLILVDQTSAPPTNDKEAISLGYLNEQLESIQTGAVGGPGNPLMFENDRFATQNYTITNGKNAMSAGPIGVNAGVTIGVPAGSVWSIVGGGSTSGPDVALGTALPQMDGIANAGNSGFASHDNHVHPSDTSRAPLASPNFLGVPTAPTAAPGTNTTQIATTAFVLANRGSGGGTPSDTPPNMDGAASAGVATTYSRGDHVHPSDTSRAPLASPALTGNPTAPTQLAGDNSTRIATTAFVTTAVVAAGGLLPSNNAPLMDGVASPGVGTAASRDDHVHPTDTSRAPLSSPAFIGTPTVPTASVGTSTTQAASTAFVQAAIPNLALQKANNLSDLPNISTAQSNIGLSSMTQFNAACTDGDFGFLGQAQSWSARQTFNAGLSEKYAAVAALSIDCSLASVFSKTISGASVLTVSNVAPAGNVSSFILELTNGGSASVTWWAGVKWPGGVAPTLMVSGTDILGFYTHDGGVTWRGSMMMADSK